MKRLLTCVIVFGLAVLGPAPSSVCSLLSSIVGECASADTQARCDQMNMNVPPAQTVAARSEPCCLISQAPLPESRNEAPKISLQNELGVVPTPVIGVFRFHDARSSDAPEDLSPPPLQSLLCTFLI